MIEITSRSETPIEKCIYLLCLINTKEPHNLFSGHGLKFQFDKLNLSVSITLLPFFNEENKRYITISLHDYNNGEEIFSLIMGEAWGMLVDFYHG